MEALPALVKTAATGAAALNPVTAVAGAAISGFAAFSAAKYKAGVARNNALIAENNATLARQTAAINAQEQDLAAGQEIGDMVARMGGSGLSLGVGSLGRRVENADELAARDRANIIYSGDLESTNLMQQADGFRSDAKNANREALFAAVATPFQMGASAVSSATRINNRKLRELGAT